MKPMIELAGRSVAPLGQGTWYMGERPAARADEVRALRSGLDLGLAMIDTAEMYGSGGAEEVVGEAIAGRRDEVLLVSKVLPSNASRSGTVAACERSLRRLRTDRLDLYLLHWQGSHPLDETLAGFERLIADGKIAAWGVSNFDAADMRELAAREGGGGCATDQVLYNLTRRWPEPDLLPYCRTHSIPVMAYSPIEQGRMLGDAALGEVAGRHDVSPAQVARAWLLRQEGVIPIPKAASLDHVAENARALDLVLDQDDLDELELSFSPPRGPAAMEML